MSGSAIAGRIRALLQQGSGSGRGWDFVSASCEKLQRQLDAYGEIPTLEELVENRAARLLPKYSGVLASCKEDSVATYVSRFCAKNTLKNTGAAKTQVKNLVAHLVKHNIHGEYIRIRDHRKSVLSEGFDKAVTFERVVNTYTRISILKFVQLLNDDAYWKRNPFKYYKEMNKSFHRVLADGKALRQGKVCMALRPADVELLIRRMMFANKMMNYVTPEEWVESDIEGFNMAIIADFQDSELKLSNKELFSLFRVSNKGEVRQVEALYDQFMASETFEKNEDFYKFFLTFEGKGDKAENDEFKRKIIIDSLNGGVEVDRYVLKYILKHATAIEHKPLAQETIYELLEKYTVDMDTLHAARESLAVFSAADTDAASAAHTAHTAHEAAAAVVERYAQLATQSASLDHERFLVRVLDLVEALAGGGDLGGRLVRR